MADNQRGALNKIQQDLNICDGSDAEPERSAGFVALK